MMMINRIDVVTNKSGWDDTNRFQVFRCLNLFFFENNNNNNNDNSVKLD